MSAQLIAASVLAAQAMLIAAMLLATWRLLRGPRAQDRALAFDALYVAAMLLMLARSIATGVTLYFEAALIIALLGFVGSLALARFLLRGEVIE
jgi:multicomponent K+:H+ antiporter subunit F